MSGLPDNCGCAFGREDMADTTAGKPRLDLKNSFEPNGKRGTGIIWVIITFNYPYNRKVPTCVGMTSFPITGDRPDLEKPYY